MYRIDETTGIRRGKKRELGNRFSMPKDTIDFTMEKWSFVDIGKRIIRRYHQHLLIYQRFTHFPLPQHLTRNAWGISGVSGSCASADTEIVDSNNSYLDIVVPTTILRTYTVSSLTESRLILLRRQKES